MVETYGGCPLINLEDQSRGRADHATAQNMVSVHRFNSGVLDAGRGGTSSRRLELPIDNDRIDSLSQLLLLKLGDGVHGVHRIPSAES